MFTKSSKGWKKRQFRTVTHQNLQFILWGMDLVKGNTSLLWTSRSWPERLWEIIVSMGSKKNWMITSLHISCPWTKGSTEVPLHLHHPKTVGASRKGWRATEEPCWHNEDGVFCCHGWKCWTGAGLGWSCRPFLVSWWQALGWLCRSMGPWDSILGKWGLDPFPAQTPSFKASSSWVFKRAQKARKAESSTVFDH